VAQILTKKQALVLKVIAETDLVSRFYFSGGTALAYFYLGHRRSEDLDFFEREALKLGEEILED